MKKILFTFFSIMAISISAQDEPFKGDMSVVFTPLERGKTTVEKSTPMVKRTINNKKIFVPEKIIHWIRNWGDCGINGRNTEIVTEEISSGNFMVGDYKTGLKLVFFSHNNDF